MASTRTLAIIIGRAGSKGLPGKNMLPIAGKPCAMDHRARDGLLTRHRRRRLQR
ncbi:MAG: cytidylyltransferase domain-containing protein [Phycisphaerales bacterium]